MTTRYLNASKTTRRSPNYESGRSGSNITGITIHWWDNPAKAPSFDGVVSWLCNPAAEVSAHFVVQDSRVSCLVHPRDKAWHARSGNTGTIGIECNPRASQADRDTLVGLIVALWLNYGKVPLYKHNHWVQTDCPGVYGTTYWQQINNDATKLYNSIQSDSVRRGQYQKTWWDAVRHGAGSSSASGSGTGSGSTAVSVDGYWGSGTTRALQRIMGTPQDGRVSSQDVYWKSKNPGLTSGWEWVNNATGSQLITKLQTLWGASPADGIIGPGTIRAMQKYYGTIQDGTLDEGSSAIMAMQRWINIKLAPTPTPPSTGGNTGSGGSTGGSSSSLVVDGYWGMDTTRALQKKYGTPQDGVVSSQDVYWKSKNPGLTGGWEWVTNASGSQLIARLQKEWGIPNGDGIIGPNTIKAMQRHYKVPQTGTLTENAPAIRKMQQLLNQNSGLVVKPAVGESDGSIFVEPQPVDPLLSWVIKTEKECAAELGGLYGYLTGTAGFKGGIGEFILGWLRKPEYWGTKSYGLWLAYTPEVDTVPELARARLLCEGICSQQKAIKNVFPRRDIAHLAVTILGYLTWGVEKRQTSYGLGDLGGWTLDLLQIWGNYDREKPKETLESWLKKHLGSLNEGKGFGYADVLADAEAWLIANYMTTHPVSEKSLSNAMREVFKQGEFERMKRFYRERFGGKPDNIVKAVKALADGIDVSFAENVPGTAALLKRAANASRLPTPDQAEKLARSYASFLSHPVR